MVLAQHFEPGSDIVGVAYRRLDAERGANEGAGHLGDQFLLCVKCRAEITREIASEAGGMTNPMAKLMQGGPVPIDGLEIGVGARDLNEIVNGAVECPLAADAKVCGRCGN